MRSVDGGKRISRIFGELVQSQCEKDLEFSGDMVIFGEIGRNFGRLLGVMVGRKR